MNLLKIYFVEIKNDELVNFSFCIKSYSHSLVLVACLNQELLLIQVLKLLLIKNNCHVRKKQRNSMIC